MKTTLKLLILGLSVSLLVGCGGANDASTQPNATQQESFKLRLEFPQTKKMQNKATQQKVADVAQMQLDVKNGSGAYLYQNSLMQKIDGVWSASLILNPTDAPFSFTVRGVDSSGEKLLYLGSATIESLLNTPSLTIKMDEVVPTDTPIVKLPYLDGINFAEDNGTTHLLFNIVNESLEDINYTFAMIGVPNECTPVFNPMSGNMIFDVLPSRILDVRFFGEANETCITSNYSLTLTTLKGERVVIPFQLDLSLKRVTVNFPPELNALRVEQQGTTFNLIANAIDPEGSDVLYRWDILEGNPTLAFQGESFLTATAILTGYDGISSVKVQLRIKDGILPDSALSTRYYTFRGSNTIVNQYKYPIKKTGQTTSYVNFDDGYYQKGVTPSYTRDATKEVVIDNIEGYMWQDDVNVTNVLDKNYTEAQAYCNNLTLGGYTNWSLPPIHMLVDLMDYSTRKVNTVFQNYTLLNIFSSTVIKDTTTNSEQVVTLSGDITTYDALSSKGSIRCLRPHTPLIMPGDVQKGANGTVIDYRYGLEWQDDYNGSTTLAQRSTLTTAIDYCETLTLGGKSDWRLPNIKELIRVIDTNKITIAPTTNRLFDAFSIIEEQGIDTTDYWSSTQSSSTDGYNMSEDGQIYIRTAGRSVRCVRDY